MNCARRHGLSLLAVATAVLLIDLAVALSIPRTGFVTVDLGAIHLQIARLAATGTADLPIGPLLGPVARDHFPWRLSSTPPRRIDDWGDFSRGWFVERDGRFLIIYPIGFAWLCALLLRALGSWGPVLVPVAAGALASWATGWLGVRLGLRRPEWAALLVGLGSPLALYSVLVWGHAPAVAAAALGFLLLTPGDGAPARLSSTAAAGLAFGAAAAFRNEGLLLAAIAGALIATVGPSPRARHALAYLLGLSLALAAPAAYNLRTFGSLLDTTQAARASAFVPGAGAASSASPDPAPSAADRLARRLSIAFRTLRECTVKSDNLGPGGQAAWGAALVLALGLIALAFRRDGDPSGSLLRSGLQVGGGAAALYLIFAALVHPQQVPGMLLCAPALIPGLAALLAPRLWWHDARLLGLTAILFLAGCALRGSPGWQWGARYMLLVLPVLAVFAVRVLERLEDLPGLARPARLHLALLAGMGVAMSLIGWRDLASEQDFHVREQQLVRDIGAPAVAFDHWWFSWENAPLALERELFFVGDPAQLAGLLDHLSRNRIGKLALVTRASAAGIADHERAASARGWGVAGRWEARLPFGHSWRALSLERSAAP